MIVEVQYKDQNGSVCPFCGAPLSVSHHKEDTFERENIVINMYPARCAAEHLSFVTTTNVSDPDECRYDFYCRQFVYYQDWEDHIDMTITAGAWETPLLDNEDDAWLIHLTALKALEEVPEPKEPNNVETD